MFIMQARADQDADFLIGALGDNTRNIYNQLNKVKPKTIINVSDFNTSLTSEYNKTLEGLRFYLFKNDDMLIFIITAQTNFGKRTKASVSFLDGTFFIAMSSFQQVIVIRSYESIYNAFLSLCYCFLKTKEESTYKTALTTFRNNILAETNYNYYMPVRFNSYFEAGIKAGILKLFVNSSQQL